MTNNNISDNTGTGIDLMINENLRWQWQWLMQCELSGADLNDKRRLPCQTCFAEVKTPLGNWRFKAIDWQDSYEAAVELNGRRLVRQLDLVNRATAQRLTETLAIDFARQILKELIS